MQLKKYKFLSIIIILSVIFCSFSVFLANDESTTIDVTYLSANEEAEHQHIYKDNYDSNQHWQECVICSIKQNVKSHNLQLIGNAPTCDVYVQLGKYVCSDNCGYSQGIGHLPHSRPANPVYTDWMLSCHAHFECYRCGGGGSNGFTEPHRYNINGVIINPYTGDLKGINPHTLGVQKCIDCNMSINLGSHIFYSNTCLICQQLLGPEGSLYNEYNVIKNGTVQIDLINNSVQYIYYKVNFKNFTGYKYATARSLKGGNFNVGSTEFVKQVGTEYYYRFPISLKDRNVPITENLILLSNGNVSSSGHVGSDGITFANSVRSENRINVNVDQSKPIINTIDAKDITTANGWATAKQITVKGTSVSNSIVYISMYYPDDTPVFERSACSVVNGNYTFSVIPEFEVSDPKDFKIVVEDDFANKSEKSISLSKVDAKAPQISFGSKTDQNWSKNKVFTISTIDNGVGDVLVSFNDQNNYHTTIKSGNQFAKTFNFVGDCYGSNNAMIYAKDSLGNIVSSKLSIYNIDNTAPTISNKTKHVLDNLRPFATVNVDANDYNQTLNKSGSGVVKYAITKENRQPYDSEWQNSNSFKVEENGTYYIYAKDLVGNISKPYVYNIDDIHYGNIILKINKFIKHQENILNNNSLESNFGFNINANQFQIILINKDTGTLTKGFVKNNSTITFDKLDIGTYKLIEFEKKGFDLQLFDMNYSDPCLSFFKENDKHYIKVNDILNTDQTIVVDSISEINSPVVMGDVVSKENFIIIN